MENIYCKSDKPFTAEQVYRISCITYVAAAKELAISRKVSKVRAKEAVDAIYPLVIELTALALARL